jgi:hypothetical protein
MYNCCGDRLGQTRLIYRILKMIKVGKNITTDALNMRETNEFISKALQ